MAGRRTLILLAVDDIPRTDRLSEELTAVGFDVVAAFSTGEAVSAALLEPPDIALIDAELEDASFLVAWIRAKCKDTLCLVHEFERSRPSETWDAEVDGAGPPDAEDGDTVTMVFSALARVKGARAAVGRS